MLSEKNEIRLLTEKIEKKLNWGNSRDWSNYDFEKLSVNIEEKTNVVLSLSTLRRVWGRVKTSHAPAITTLNCLAQFIDFEDWRSFKKVNIENKNNDVIAVPDTSKKIEPVEIVKQYRKSLTFIGIGTLAVMLLLFGIFFFANSFKSSYNPKDFTFTANKIRTKGLPNSVIFSYDATKARTDSVFIVQNWDLSRKTLVPKNGKNHSSIYYYPGYFRTKLLIEEKIIKTHDIQILTDGWLALAETEGQPVYFDKNNNDNDGFVTVDDKILQQNNITDPATNLRIYYQTDIGNFNSDDFSFETKIKNNSKEACPQVRVIIHAIDNAIVVPLTTKHCVGDIRLSAFGETIESKYTDLSGFGADLSQWCSLKVIGKGQNIYFYINGKIAHTLNYQIQPARIVGVQYRFNGTIAVKESRFAGGGKLFELK